MRDVYRSHTGYFGRAFGDIEDIAYNMIKTLDTVKFDTMVGTGLSGTLVVPTLARAFGVHWAIIRKEVSIHTNTKIEGDIGQNWLFVDDFISSGETLRRVQNIVNGITWSEYDQTTWSYQTVNFTTNYVGTYEYEKDQFVQS